MVKGNGSMQPFGAETKHFNQTWEVLLTSATLPILMDKDYMLLLYSLGLQLYINTEGEVGPEGNVLIISDTSS